MITRRKALLSLLLVPAVASCSKPSGGGAPAEGAGPAPESTAAKAIKIAVIPKGTTHEFWKSVHAGAAKASTELGVSMIWKGPLKEDDLKAQIDIVESMVAQGVAGIVLAPLNDKALVGSVKAAAAAKIPVVIFDSALQGKDFVSFVATDNDGAGARAAEHLGKLLGGKGKVLVLRYQEGSASTAAREEGFLRGLREAHSGLTVVSNNQYGGATTESAFTASENLLAAQKAAEGGVDGIFCPNESTTFGMLLALQKIGLAGKVKLVGFDASEKLVKGLRDGHIDALVVQDPFKMGDLSVRALVDHLHGHSPQARIDTGVRLVTKADLEDPAVKELLHPDLKKWLGE
jgi:ribose transport system substrate-binding protein